MIFLTTLLFSVFITISLVPLFSRLAVRIHLLDLPDARKVHTTPIPRSGGMAMAIGALVPIIFWGHSAPFVRWYLIGSALIVLSGLADDLWGLSARTKFMSQIVASLFVIVFGEIRIKDLGLLLPEGVLLPDWISIPLTLIAIVGVTNAINLADGLDGLAGGICLLIFACLTFLAYLVQDGIVGLLSIALGGAVFGFLRFNTFPASIFMGDTGSQFLGFSSILLSLHLTQTHPCLSPLLPLIILGFPVLDTIAVMAQRYQEGRPLFKADKNHFHHRLIRLGFYQTESVLLIYVIQSGLVVFAYLLRFQSEWTILVSYLIFASLVIGAFNYANKKGYQIKRTDLIDRMVKGKLKELKEKGTIIRFAFRVIEFGIPLLLLFAAILPARIPTYVSLLSFLAIAGIVATWRFWKKHLGLALRGCLYLLIPYLIYMGQVEPLPWMRLNLMRYYNLSFFLFAIFIVLTIRFSRRRQGFRSTPMDFLILFIAFVVPNLPVEEIQTYQLGIVAAKIITLFFSYEVLMGELRESFGRLTVLTLLTLAVVLIKGVV